MDNLERIRIKKLYGLIRESESKKEFVYNKKCEPLNVITKNAADSVWVRIRKNVGVTSIKRNEIEWIYDQVKKYPKTVVKLMKDETELDDLGGGLDIYFSDDENFNVFPYYKRINSEIENFWDNNVLYLPLALYIDIKFAQYRGESLLTYYEANRDYSMNPMRQSRIEKIKSFAKNFYSEEMFPRHFSETACKANKLEKLSEKLESDVIRDYPCFKTLPMKSKISVNNIPFLIVKMDVNDRIENRVIYKKGDDYIMREASSGGKVIGKLTCLNTSNIKLENKNIEESSVPGVITPDGEEIPIISTDKSDKSEKRKTEKDKAEKDKAEKSKSEKSKKIPNKGQVSVKDVIDGLKNKRFLLQKGVHKHSNEYPAIREVINMFKSKLNLETNGIFDEKMENVVKKYQEKNDLKIDGKIGVETGKSLFNK